MDRVAEATGFSGVVRVDRPGRESLVAAHGHAHRGWAIANRPEHRFAMASGSKGFTALAVMGLVEDGVLALSTPARDLLGEDLPLIDDRVTVEHLLAHRSGIGDYLDEDAGHDIDDHVLTVAPHELVTSDDYLAVLDGHPQVFPPGERFAYNNGGFVVLALLAERASGTAFCDLVDQRVCAPAGMVDTAYGRSDVQPGGLAVGYLQDGERTNAHHLPLRGSGDGGAHTTVADMAAFWEALLAGRIVTPGTVAEMVRPRSDAPLQGSRYGLGLWLHVTEDVVLLVGCDAGVSFRSVVDPRRRITHTVVANTSSGAWPLTRLLDELLAN
ncbi:MAG: serine hydrolase domain-containing protein [Actinomycetota bacterium]|nr:serine hydrolase domain-containing protein [Actinomycetota bacterium]